MSTGIGSKKHVHKYHKTYPNTRRNEPIWACALPDCTHFMPHNVSQHVPGKVSICWSCGNEFILDEDNMKVDQPVCFNCSGVDFEGLDKLFREKGL